MTPTKPPAKGRGLDSREELLDVAHLSERVTRIEGANQLLASEMRSSNNTVSNALNNVQIEVRNLTSKFDGLASLQHSHDANREQVAEVKSSIAEVNDKLDQFFADFERTQENKWEKYERDRDKWRSEHEADNRVTRERIILWSGIGFAAILLGGAVVSGFVWVLNMRFQQQSVVTDKIEARHIMHEQQQQSLTNKVHEVELYLARTGKRQGEQ